MLLHLILTSKKMWLVGNDSGDLLTIKREIGKEGRRRRRKKRGRKEEGMSKIKGSCRKLQVNRS